MVIERKLASILAIWFAIAALGAVAATYLGKSIGLETVAAKIAQSEAAEGLAALDKAIASNTMSGFMVASGDVATDLPANMAETAVPGDDELKIALFSTDNAASVVSEAKAKSGAEIALFRVESGRAWEMAATFPYAAWLTEADLERVAAGHPLTRAGVAEGFDHYVVADPIRDGFGNILGISVIAHDGAAIYASAGTIRTILLGIALLIMFVVATVLLSMLATNMDEPLSTRGYAPNPKAIRRRGKMPAALKYA